MFGLLPAEKPKMTGKEHDLKTWPNPFSAVWTKQRHHEIRINDRDYKVGDVLKLREWCPLERVYSGRVICALVTYISRGGEWGLPSVLCVMSFVEIERWKFDVTR
jgi:ParB family chromosome partitioning protein